MSSVVMTPAGDGSGGGDCSSDMEHVETDPTGRYMRYREILGRGAFKTVYKAFDGVEGIEVAWNQVRTNKVVQSQENLQQLYSEVQLLKSLQHDNIIRYYYSWVDGEKKTINIITELFTSGNLREYRMRYKNVDMKAVKKWAFQILRGLDYLHSHSPPIIHRDIKCDNIFVNGNHGEIKIGDLGLATIMHQPSSNIIIGTPEFMAPELYKEDYNELVDIYAFGMCMLEMVTFEYPYNECKSNLEIYKKVSSGEKPVALSKVSDSFVKQFIEKCLLPVSERLPAKELLKDSFFMGNMYDFCGLSNVALSASGAQSKTGSMSSDMDLSRESLLPPVASFAEQEYEIPETIVLECQRVIRNDEYFRLKGVKKDAMSIEFVLLTPDLRSITFMFYVNSDTSLSIARELVELHYLSQDDAVCMPGFIDFMIAKFVPDWKPSSPSSSNGTPISPTATLPPDQYYDPCRNNQSTSILVSRHTQTTISFETCSEKTAASSNNSNDILEKDVDDFMAFVDFAPVSSRHSDKEEEEEDDDDDSQRSAFSMLFAEENICDDEYASEYIEMELDEFMV